MKKFEDTSEVKIDTQDKKLGRAQDIMEEIRIKAEGQSLNLPQMVVIGAQGSGKSTLLSAISGLRFPQALNTCTKCPIVVALRKSESIFVRVNGAYIDAPKAEGARDTAMLKAQLMQKVEEKIIELNNGYNEITDKPINIEYHSPTQSPLTLVDLPGIIHSDQRERETMSISKKFISGSNTTILLIREANNDKETQKAVALAREVDPEGDRTIEVLTKADNIGTNEKRRLIILDQNQTKNDKRGIHVVCCRLKDNDNTPYAGTFSRKDEMAFFRGDEWQLTRGSPLELDSPNIGVENLMKRILRILGENMKENSPKLRVEIQEKLKICQDVINDLGETPRHLGEVLSNICEELKSVQNELEEAITPLLEDFANTVHDICIGLKHSFTDQFYKPNAYDPIFFAGKDAFERSIKAVSEQYRVHLIKLSQDIKTLSICSVNESPVIQKSNYDRLTVKIKERWAEQFNAAWVIMEKEMATKLRDIGKYNTRNHYITSKYQEDMTFPKELQEKFLESLNPSSFCTEARTTVNCTNGEHTFCDTLLSQKYHSVVGMQALGKREFDELMSLKLRSCLDEYFAAYARKSLQEQQKMRVFSAVSAYVYCAHKTFLDDVMSIIRRCVLETRINWLNREFMSSQEFRDATKENIANEMRRAKALKTRNVMRECLENLDEAVDLIDSIEF